MIRATPPARALPKEVATAIIQGYYARGVAAADRARDRADKGYTIASAVATALVAAGVFTHLDKQPTWVQITGLVALGLWLLAALLFIYAVSLPVADKTSQEGWDSELAFAKGVADQVRGEVKTLRLRLLVAVTTTVIATAVTLTALLLATVLPAPTSTERERIVLTAKGDADVAKLCTNRVGDIWASVDPSTLEKAIVTFTMPAKECNATKMTLHLPKGDIAATEKVAHYPKFPL